MFAWLGLSVASTGVCLAQNAPSPAKAAPWLEVSAGSTVMAHSWSAYSSSTISPFGGLNADGLRVRLGGGYGRYHYTIPERFYYTCPKPSLICPPVPVKARVAFSDVLVGYQLSQGRFTAKAFVGVAIDTQSLAPFDENNQGAGRDYGLKVAVETWTNITPTLWLSVDGGWTQAHEGRMLQARLGYRLMPHVSLGFEEGMVRNIAGHQFRSGLFGRYEWSDGEAILSGGISGENHDYPDRSKESAWGAFNVIFRF